MCDTIQEQPLPPPATELFLSELASKWLRQIRRNLTASSNDDSGVLASLKCVTSGGDGEKSSEMTARKCFDLWREVIEVRVTIFSDDMYDITVDVK